jgi:hypothetical protein
MQMWDAGSGMQDVEKGWKSKSQHPASSILYPIPNNAARSRMHSGNEAREQRLFVAIFLIA